MDEAKGSVAVYPCCGQDFLEPTKIMCDSVDSIIFCDKDPTRQKNFQSFKDRQALTLDVNLEFALLDAKTFLKTIPQIDTFFYRGDSEGEGGSGLHFFSGDLFTNIVEKMPSMGGRIITDGSNCWDKTFRKMIRPQGTCRYGWRVKPIDSQPIKTKRSDLWILSVRYEGGTDCGIF